MEGVSHGGLLTSLPVRLPAAPDAAQAGHRKRTGDSGTLLSRELEASTGDLSQMVDALKGYFEKRLERVERTFLSAHIHQTGTRVSCVRARHDSPPSPPLEKGRRYLLDHFCLHSGRRTMRRADRNVYPTFTHHPAMAALLTGRLLQVGLKGPS